MEEKMRLELNNIFFSYDGQKALKGISCAFESGKFYGIFGPNGSGKSTLLKIITGELPPQSGSIAPHLPLQQRARFLALVEQETPPRIPLRVREVVALGRYPWRRQRDNPAALENALNALALLPLAERPFNHLSGGEKQRVLLARALAQDTELLLLDEPASSLDLKHQITFYCLLQQLTRQGKCVVMVSQDLFLAPQYLDQALLLKNGQLAACGIPNAILDAANIQQVFGCTLPTTSAGTMNPLACEKDRLPCS